MSVSRTRNHKDGRDEVGLLAFGSSGPWEVAIDEALAGPARHFAQIEGPSVYLYVEIPSAELVDQAIDFLTVQRDTPTKSVGTNGTMSVFKDADAHVSLVKDDEFEDRYFLVVEAESGPLVRLTVTGEDLNHLAKALRSVKEDLQDDGGI
jgi:hypothetical protein